MVLQSTWVGVMNQDSTELQAPKTCRAAPCEAAARLRTIFWLETGLSGRR